MGCIGGSCGLGRAERTATGGVIHHMDGVGKKQARSARGAAAPVTSAAPANAVVQTTGAGLNLRSKPSLAPDTTILTQLPNGTVVIVLAPPAQYGGAPGQWALVSTGAGGKVGFAQVIGGAGEQRLTELAAMGMGMGAFTGQLGLGLGRRHVAAWDVPGLSPAQRLGKIDLAVTAAITANQPVKMVQNLHAIYERLSRAAGGEPASLAVLYAQAGRRYTPPLDPFTNAPTTSHASVKDTLMRGAQGDLVSLLQRLLQETGQSWVVVDGDFGEQTEEAVRSFQQARGLTPTGVVDTVTWRALEAASPTSAATGQFSTIPDGYEPDLRREAERQGRVNDIGTVSLEAARVLELYRIWESAIAQREPRADGASIAEKRRAYEAAYRALYYAAAPLTGPPTRPARGRCSRLTACTVYSADLRQRLSLRARDARGVPVTFTIAPNAPDGRTVVTRNASNADRVGTLYGYFTLRSGGEGWISYDDVEIIDQGGV